MRSSFITLLTLGLAAGVYGQNTFSIITPANVVECEPQLITWTGGVAPYFLSVLPGNQPGAAALEDLGQQNGTSVTWLVNLQSGQQIGLTLRDSTGQVAQSAPFPILPGSSTSCLSATSLSEGSATAPPQTGTTTAAGGTTTTEGSGATTTPKPTSGTGTSSTTSPSTTTTKSGASRFAEISVAGIVGAVVAALFA